MQEGSGRLAMRSESGGGDAREEGLASEEAPTDADEVLDAATACRIPTVSLTDCGRSVGRAQDHAARACGGGRGEATDVRSDGSNGLPSSSSTTTTQRPDERRPRSVAETRSDGDDGERVAAPASVTLDLAPLFEMLARARRRQGEPPLSYRLWRNGKL